MNSADREIQIATASLQSHCDQAMVSLRNVILAIHGPNAKLTDVTNYCSKCLQSIANNLPKDEDDIIMRLAASIGFMNTCISVSEIISEITGDGPSTS